jgi:septum site-determining protein MinD
MARIISFVSGKGGTGKTIVVANLGVAIAQLGKRTIAIDADVTMADLGLVLGLTDKKVTLNNLLSGEGKIEQAICIGPAGLKVVPCSMSLNKVREARLERLKKVVEKLAEKTDFLLVDSPSGMDNDSITALTLAQEVILVVNPDFVSVFEAIKVKIVAERLHVKPIGVVINRARGDRSDISPQEIGTTLDLPVLEVIQEDAEVRRATALGESVVIRSPKSLAANAFKELAGKLVKQKIDSQASQ